MKIHEYNEMMAYLTRPATGGRVKLADGLLDFQIKILEQFPEADFTKGRYGFSKKDPRYEKARTIQRRVTGKFKSYEETRKLDPERIKYRKDYIQKPEVKERTRNLQRSYYQDP